ncbi:hypothetical protein WG915_07300 [Corynebacterium sp. H128]|uniref:hypothetical protein n=1 Tax=Corynebacterium sp. H128 TaxID=3133427 RepID=UPI00309B5EA1
MLKLTCAARIVIRPGPALQFGVDATRSGIIDSIAPQHIGAVVNTLNATRAPVSRDELQTRLVSSGLDATAASSLIADLLAFGILLRCSTVEPRVGVLGRGALASEISELLARSGCTVRRPLRGETDTRFLRMLPPEVPLVAADKLAHSRALAPAVRNGHREFFLPVALVDGIGLVGPVASHDSGPCPLCVDLHRVAVDPYWTQLLTQLSVSAAAPSLVLVAATAAQAVALVLQHLGMHSPAVGSPVAPLAPGRTLQVDPYRTHREFFLRSHAGCPLCFETQHLKQGFAEIRDLDRANS